MKVVLATIALSAIHLIIVEAGTITLSSNSGFPVRDSTGGIISGGAIRVGFLDLTSPRDFIVEHSSDFQKIDAHWTPLAEGTTNGGTVAQAGNTSETLIVNDQFAAGEFFGQITNASSFPQGTKLFLWVFNHTNPSEATEWALISSSNSSWAMPGLIGSTTLSSDSADQIFRGTLTINEIRLEPKDAPSGFNAWAVENFNFSQLSNSEADDSADPDKDDWTNIMEYVFGTDPNVPSDQSNHYRIVTNVNGDRSLSFQRAENTEDVEISGAVSTDLQIWLPENPVELMPNIFELPLPAGKQAFARLLFTRP